MLCIAGEHSNSIEIRSTFPNSTLKKKILLTAFSVQHYIDSALKYQDPKFIAIELRAAAKDPDIYTTGHVLAAISRMPNSPERMKILSGFMAFDQKHKTKISKLPNRYGFPEDKGRGDNLIDFELIAISPYTPLPVCSLSVSLHIRQAFASFYS